MEALPSNYQAATLVALPYYPSSLAWSKENLVAIASEHLITILNPASLSSPRAVITLRQNKPFPIGLVERKGLLTPCLQPICLSRDSRPCARSISWSPLGLAPNSGCFLAVCTIDGRVKLYRAPYCEYNSEWIEVAEISDLLFDYVTKVNYGKSPVGPDLPLVIHGLEANSTEQNSLNSGFSDAIFSKFSGSRKRKCMEDLKKSKSVIINFGECHRKNGTNIKEMEDIPNNGYATAQQYAIRNAVLSSLAVSWSPLLQSCETCCAVLVIGTKSGAVYFWRICEPQYYTIKHGNIPVNAMLVGLIQAHDSWITSICSDIFDACSSQPQLVLATGSSDGSVKIWSSNAEVFILATEVKSDCFSLLVEVTTATNAPVSTIAFVIPAKSPDHAVLAVGRGAGQLEVWIYNIISKKLHFVADYNVHQQVVTGLAWTSDGSCLYSCSQDNSIRSWKFHVDSLFEAPLPSNFPPCGASNTLSRVSDLCFGLALSPGELILAVVRSFDANLQHEMYEKRSQRAFIEFFGTSDGFTFESISSSPKPEFAGSILCVLKTFENVNKPLVIWDVTSLLRDFKKSFSSSVENVITKWISNWFSDPSMDSPQKTLFNDLDKISTISSRKIQLLSIICRKVMIGEIKTIDLAEDDNRLNEDCWDELLSKCEREMRERLVAFSLRAVLNHTANIDANLVKESTRWSPVGVAQMEQWIASKNETIRYGLKVLVSDIAQLKCRNSSGGISEYVEKESCSFCSLDVPFESPEFAWCKGDVNQKERHKHVRCAASMRLCQATESLWLCVCCGRLTANPLPRSFFMEEGSPLAFIKGNSSSSSSMLGERLKPLCPFCGILLQRPMPDFFMSASPV